MLTKTDTIPVYLKRCSNTLLLLKGYYTYRNTVGAGRGLGIAKQYFQNGCFLSFLPCRSSQGPR